MRSHGGAARPLKLMLFLLELSDRTNELAKAHTKMLGVSKDTEDVPVSSNERDQRGFAHSRMWTDYAGRHSGVCLIFDRTKLHEAIRNFVAPETVYADRMTYSEWTPEVGEAFTIELDTPARLGLDRGLFAHIRTCRRSCSSTRNLNWASEVEFRWLVFGETPTPEFVPFGDALEGMCVA
jgi:hypothetical protein